MKTAFIYSDKFSAVTYGADHPMRSMRLGLTYDMIKESGLLDLPGAQLIAARKATEQELLLIHTPEYIDMLRQCDSGQPPSGAAVYALGAGDNPVFKGVFEWSSYSAGASVQAAELVASGECRGENVVAFNIAGGLHHAMAARAAGFCYLNDPAVAIARLLELGKRVAYIDIDAHHGDGVEAAFYETNKCLTISIHESGRYLFPGTGFPGDIGAGAGKGYAVNLPMPPGAGDSLFVRGFQEVVPCFLDAFSPDVIVTQLGVDTFRTDPITHLNLTTAGFEEMLAFFKSTNLPWVALGGGGYNMDNVRRAWTLAWAVMCGVEPPEGVVNDEPADNAGIVDDYKYIEKDVTFLKSEVLPLVHHNPPLP